MADEEEEAGNRRDSSSPSERQRRRGQPTSAASAAPSPDDVLRLLENCQLTDEEADELLKDAYALNRLLRAHIAHVEASSRNGEAASASSAASRSGKSRQSSGGGGGGDFSRQLGGGAVRHEQSSSRRSVSLSGRTHVAMATSAASSRQQRLPPIRAKSPGQRLSEMARAYSSGVVQAGHRGGGPGAAAEAAKSTKKHL